jgi:adenylate cyclase
MVASRMPETARPAPAKKRTAPAAAAATETPARSYTAELARRGIDPETIDGDFYSEATVMVVHFTDPMALAVRAPDAARAMSDRIACALQQTAHDTDIPYLKIVGQDVVAAAGLGPQGGNGAMLIAQAALAVRDQCLSLFEESDDRQVFRIGIDCGGAVGSSIGSNPRIFNLWGEAVRLADQMASTALPGTIQVTAAAYERLSHDFLFRQRGSFYLPRLGESRTYIMAGRL